MNRADKIFGMILLIGFSLFIAISIGWSEKTKTMEDFDAFTTYMVYESSNTEVQTATHAVGGILLSWQVESLGGVTAFTIDHSTGTGFEIQTSSRITVNSGKTLTDDARGFVKNPRLILKSLAAGATVFFRMIYMSSK